jgi:hypothetical protein
VYVLDIGENEKMLVNFGDITHVKPLSKIYVTKVIDLPTLTPLTL